MNVFSGMSVRRLMGLGLIASSLCRAGSAPPSVTFLTSPSSISNTYTGAITLQIGGLTNGETVRLDKYLDTNTNGVIDAGDLLVQSGQLTDGQPPMVIGGVTNSNVPYDSNPASGVITVSLNFLTASIEQKIVGQYLCVLSSPTGRFAPVTNSFAVANTAYPQWISGKVQCNGTNVPNAGVFVFPPPSNNGGGGPIAGTVADGSGTFTITMPPGAYSVWAFKSNYVSDMSVAPLVAVNPSSPVTTNLNLILATRTISGRLVNAPNASIGLPGVLLPVQSTDNSLIAIGFTDTNGNYSVPVTAGGWTINADDNDLPCYAYLGLNNGVSVDTTTGSVSGVTVAFPMVNALFYGSVKDSLGNPLAGIDVGAWDINNLYDTDVYTDANGNYVVGVLGGLNNDPWQVVIDAVGTYVFSRPDFESGDDGTNIGIYAAEQINFTAIHATNTISGSLKDNSGNPIPGIGICAGAGINGLNFSQYADTDDDGNYRMNVGNGTWYVSVNTGGGDDSLPSSYLPPNGQTVEIANSNAVVNFVAATVQTPYTYINNGDSSCTITGYTGSGGAVTIPGTIAGLSVTCIGNAAFQGNGSLTSVTIPDSVTNIGDFAFNNCGYLTNVVMGTNVINIGGAAFQQCGLTSVTIPDSVTSLGWSAFFNCNGLTSVTIPNSVASIGGYAFAYCSGLTSATVGIGISDIEDSAFQGCGNLTAVYFTGNPPSLGGGSVFSGVNSGATVYYLQGTTGWTNPWGGLPTMELVQYVFTDNGGGSCTITAYTGSGGNVTIPGALNGLTVTSIGNAAFSNCTSLTSVTIPDSVTSIGDYAFDACAGLTNVVVGSGVTTIGNSAFDACAGLTNLLIPDSVINIWDWAFASCSNLASVTIGANVQNIGQFVFADCTSLSNATIPDSVTYLGNWVFHDCSGLTNVTIGSGVPAIGAFAFNNCVNLASVTIPGSVTTIGYFAFAGDASLVSVTITGAGITTTGVVTINDWAFSSCVNLTSVTVPASVTSIGDYTFAFCTNLATIDFQGNAPTLGGGSVFSGDSATVYYVPGTTGWGSTYGGLQAMPLPSQFNYTVNPDGTVIITGYTGRSVDVVIPGSINGLPVTSIGNDAFSGCTGMTSVVIPNSVASIGNGAFWACYSLTNIALSSSLTSIGDWAFYNCTNLTSIIIPPSVTRIGNGAFFNSPSLTGVFFQGNAPASLGSNVFFGDHKATVYYLPGTTGWGSTFGGRPTALWILPVPYSYTVAAGSVTITGYLGNGGVVTIPGTLAGLPVTSIGDWAFYNCTSLTSVIIPNSVTDIEDEAFCFCTNLASVTIPDSVTSIGDGAFFYCTSLTSVTIPADVTRIGDSAFFACTSLTAACFEGNAPVAEGDASYLFGGDPATIYYLPGTTGWGSAYGGISTEIWHLPGSSVTVMVGASSGGTATGGGTYAVGTNIQLTAIASNGWLFESWSDGTTSNPYAITVPATNVSYTANFVSLYTYTTNNGTLTITGYMGPRGAVSVPGTIGGVQVGGIGSGAFAFDTGLTGVALPGSIGNIGHGAFQNCTNLTGIMIPNGVTNIGYGAFKSCAGLMIVTIGTNVTNIGSNTFFGCTSLTNVTIPASVTNIGAWAFFDCASLASVTLPGAITNIGHNAFQNCTLLSGVVIPNSVTNIGYGAFQSCTALASLTLGTNVINIGSNAFQGCTSLYSVAIPASVTSIGVQVFDACTILTAIAVNASNPVYSSMNGVLFNKAQTTLIQYPAGKTGSYTIPGSVTSIGNDAFDACTGLAAVYFQGNPPSLGASAFNGDDNATIYYLPGTTGWGSMFGGRTAVLWNPQVRNDVSFGVQANRFGFTITNAGNPAIVVDACTNLAHPVWWPVATNVLTGGTSYFSDPGWSNHPMRFYRFRSP